MAKPCYDRPHRPFLPMPVYESILTRDAEYREGNEEDLREMEAKFRKSVQSDDDRDALIETEAQMPPAMGVNHPLAHLAGKYADEPLWDDFMAAIEEYRRKQNELEDIAE